MADMQKKMDPTQVHCYTNPSFCRQSEYIPEDCDATDLPPPPQFQVDDLPPPPVIHPSTPQYGQSNPAFHGSPEVDIPNNPPSAAPSPALTAATHQRNINNLNRTTTAVDRYCYIDEPLSPPISTPKRYGSLPLGGRAYAYRTHRYEYIQDDATVQVQVAQQRQQQQQQQQQIASNANSRYEFVEHTPQPRTVAIRQQQQLVSSAPNSIRASARSYRSADSHYSALGPDGVAPHDPHWNEDDAQAWNTSRRHINTPKGRYTSLPMQDEELPPSLPERNAHETSSHRVHATLATQKLHEILTTPRKPRTRSQGDPLSPIGSPKSQQQQPAIHNVTLTQRGIYTPGCSPSGAGQRAMNLPAHPQQQQQQQQGTPQNRALSPRSKGPTTSTPNKEPRSARRCLPLNDQQSSSPRRYIDDNSIQYGRAGIPVGQPHRLQIEEDAVIYSEKKAAQANGFYQGPESAFIARTAVVPPLSPQMSSDANTTLVSSSDKSERKNAPIILALVGILTCGLAVYLSYTQGRKYYFDSAISCGACCALAGACRSMRRTWTGLGLAGLSALSCGGLLILAAKAPRPGTPLHDITAGALCGVSLLGAALALLALVGPKCTFGRHRRVHSWIPRFQP